MWTSLREILLQAANEGKTAGQAGLIVDGKHRNHKHAEGKGQGQEGANFENKDRNHNHAEGKLQGQREPKTDSKLPNHHQHGEAEHLMWTGIITSKSQLIPTERTTTVLDRVAFHAGETYREVVKRCLTAGHDLNEIDDAEASVEIEIGIAKLLGEIRC